MTDQLRHTGEKGRDDPADMVPPDLPLPVHLIRGESELFRIEFTESGCKILRQEFFLRKKLPGPDLFQDLQKSRIVNTRRTVHRRIIMIQNKAAVFHHFHSTTLGVRRTE